MEIVNRVQHEAGLHHLHCTLLDIGGGYPGRDGIGGDVGRFVGRQHPVGPDTSEEGESTQVETAKHIAEVVTPLLDELFPVHNDHNNVPPIQLIAEPGRYFVEAAFALCSRIYRIWVEDDNQHRHYYIAQGVRGLFKDCILCGESFLPIPLVLDKEEGKDATNQVDGNKHNEQQEELVPCTVHGPSGEDYDVICRNYKLPVLQVGDWLLFDRMGAYTLSIAARSGRPTVRYVVGGHKLNV